jgi:hypothetical protein
VDKEIYSWCLAPGRGVLRFHSSSLENGPSLEKRVMEAREALLLGELALDSSSLEGGNCPTKMPTRGHHLNASSYSLSSLFSVGSVSSRAGSARWAQQRPGPVWQSPQSLQSLYDLLLAPFEDLLPMPRRELVLVVEESLYLAPLPALQASPSGPLFFILNITHNNMIIYRLKEPKNLIVIVNYRVTGDDYLCERFSLLVVPSLHVLRRRSKTPMPEGNATVAALVVGNPSVPEKVREEYGWAESVSSAESEASIVAELLETRPVLGKCAAQPSRMSR